VQANIEQGQVLQDRELLPRVSVKREQEASKNQMSELIPYDEYVCDMKFMSELSEKISTHKKPLSYLLNNRIECGMADFPSYPEYIVLLERVDPKFKLIMKQIEDEILRGSSYSGVVDAVDKDDFIKIKGNQILHSMVGKGSAKADKEAAEKKGGMDVLKLLDQINPSILAGVKEQIECK